MRLHTWNSASNVKTWNSGDPRTKSPPPPTDADLLSRVATIPPLVSATDPPLME